jgi:protein-lysine N-methyltransferase EEF2KMT
LTARRYRTLPDAYRSTWRACVPVYSLLSTATHRAQTRGPEPALLYPDDPRNEHLLLYVGTSPGYGRVFPRDLAGVSPFDSIVQGGDATWEGLRVYRGKVLCLDQHLARLYRSAKALGFDMDRIHTREQIRDAIWQVLAANGMRDGVHVRLSLSRGEKCTSSMNPKFNVYGSTLIIVPEWKPVQGQTTYDNSQGISLFTASQRRNPPSTLDSKIHHNNLINNILPKIQANFAGCADALMLDVDGYVSETNATNIFMVDEDGTLCTPPADSCLPGITRQAVLTLAREAGMAVDVRRLSLAEFHSAAEVFTTGTMGELTPVVAIDGRIISTTGSGPVTRRLQQLYQTLPEREGWATPIPPFDEP